MRVITGLAKGRRLKDLPGTDTRPTTDRVKEAVFSVIQFDIAGRTVLDLFAGTGQLGIEALSRGALHADFVEQSRPAAALVRENLILCQMEDRASIHQGDGLAFLAAARKKYDLIFLDPPYGTGLLQKSLDIIQRLDLLQEDGMIICESSFRELLPPMTPPYTLYRSYRYGKIQVAVCRKEDP